MKSGYHEATINGKKMPLKFGTNAFELLTTMHNKDLSGLDEILNSPGGMRDLVFCAAKAVQLAKGQELKVNVYEIGDWLDEMEQKDLDAIMKAFGEAKVYGNKLSVDHEQSK